MADNTASLVVALSAQLTKFEKDMRAAGIMAEKAADDIEKKFSNINPQVSSSFLGNLFSNIVTKGIDAATKALMDFKDRFLELDKQAKVTGETMENLWGFQEAARASGATTEDALKGLREMANLLNQMKRGQGNSLQELFDVNPQALEGINRQSLTVQQTWQIVANLVRDAKTEFDKIDIARLAGFSEDMVKTLEKGGDALKKSADAASAAAPPLQQMAEQAKLFDGYMKSATEWIKADLAQGIANTRRELIAILSFFEGGVWRHGPLDTTDSDLLKKLRGTEAAEKTGARVRIATGAQTSNVPVRATGGGGDTQSALDRQVDQLEKHILLLEADTAAVGKNVGEQERLKTEALLVAAAQKDGVTATGEYAEALKLLAVRAGQARLEQAKAAEHMQQIQAAYQTVGSAVSTAFADAIIEGKKLNEVLDSLVKTLARAAINTTIGNLFKMITPGSISGFAGGTDFAPGGMAMVGEHGPELVNLPRGSQVIPNDVLRSGSGGGGAIVYSPAIDARGASVEAVARLAQIMEQDRATFASRTVATIQQARRGRVPGL
jgi:hypothetical protein